eukprot:gb/GFBE01070235.1/.p1 GENE.gb/GFBE01070235.1/~~gb/GFBE01070235.1/.p1  ORF type:complete len:130 (+),score=24.59 gb/GFBE01070235.1/:1-390(+)
MATWQCRGLGGRRPSLPHLAAVLVVGQWLNAAAAMAAENQTQCPDGTWPFRNGSHCCRFSLDSDGNAIAYVSSTCYGNHLTECPTGAVQGFCKDLPVQVSRAVSAPLHLAFFLPMVSFASLLMLRGHQL